MNSLEPGERHGVSLPVGSCVFPPQFGRSPMFVSGRALRLNGKRQKRAVPPADLRHAARRVDLTRRAPFSAIAQPG